MVDAKLGPRPRGLGPWWNDLSHADRSAQGAVVDRPQDIGPALCPTMPRSRSLLTDISAPSGSTPWTRG